MMNPKVVNYWVGHPSRRRFTNTFYRVFTLLFDPLHFRNHFFVTNFLVLEKSSLMQTRTVHIFGGQKRLRYILGLLGMRRCVGGGGAKKSGRINERTQIWLFASTINDSKVKHIHTRTRTHSLSLFLSHASFFPSRQTLPSIPAVQFTIAHVSLFGLCVSGGRVCVSACVL